MTAILLHAHPSMRERYEQAIGEPVTIVNSRGSQLSSGYDERSGFASQPLPAFLAEHAPEHRDTMPLVLMGFSAGCFAIRHWLRDAQNRRDITAAVLLDGLHGDDAAKLGGALEYARLVRSDPERRRLVVTHSRIVPPTYPSTKAAADWLIGELGGKRGHAGHYLRDGVIVLDYRGTDGDAHRDQLQAHGPRVLRDYVRPLLASLPDTEPAPPIDRPLRLRALDWCLREAERWGDMPVATDRIDDYMAGCERGGFRLGLTKGKRWNFCAAAQGFAEHAAVTEQEDAPPWRAAAKEIMRDASESDRRGWYPREEIDSGWRPPPGALAIYHRGPPGAWTGHVDRVIDVDATGYRNVGANERGGRWSIEHSRFDNPNLLGFVVDDSPTPPRQVELDVPATSVEPPITDMDRRQILGMVALTLDGQVTDLRRGGYGRG